MKWSKMELMRASKIPFTDEITFDASAFSKMNQLRGLRDVKVTGEIRYDDQDDRAYANIDLQGVMIVPCAISNEDVEYPFHTTSDEVFAFEKSDDDAHETKGDVVELLPVIFQLILMEVPLKAVKEGATYPKGKGWEVISESEWHQEKKDVIDPRLAKLKDFKVEEDVAGGANNGSTTKT